MSQTTIEDRCRGVLIGLAAVDRIGRPIRLALLLGSLQAAAQAQINSVAKVPQAELPTRKIHYLVAPQFGKPGAGLRLTALIVQIPN